MVVSTVVSSVVMGNSLVHLSVAVGWYIMVPVVIVVMSFESSSLSSDVVGWLDEVSSMGVETVSFIFTMMAVVIEIAVDVLLIAEVVGSDDWLVVVVGGWVVPVNVASVPGGVGRLFDWLLDVESSVVIMVLSVVSSMLEWNGMDLS